MANKACCAPAPEARAMLQVTQSDARSAADPRTRMLPLSGGAFLMGTDYAEAFIQDGEGPVREVRLNPFWMDRTPVTNALFAKFVQESGYVTDAERFGWSFVFHTHITAARFSALVVDQVAAAPWWCKVPGASWHAPSGPGSDNKNKLDHPVTHVSWNDAVSFCNWSGQRLPTEAEWEFAARGGLVQKLYPWGDKLRVNGQHLCNIWQGEFPSHDTGEDGYTGTCPVESFPPNGYGLYSITGNTWEWCADWFSDSFHADALQNDNLQLNPKGPSHGSAKVIKGGSFLCHKSYCNRYRVAARSSNTADSSTSHMGFRCAMDSEVQES